MAAMQLSLEFLWDPDLTTWIFDKLFLSVFV